jgi:hypothetical protein
MSKTIFLLLGALMLGILAVVILSDSHGDFSEMSGSATAVATTPEETSVTEECKEDESVMKMSYQARNPNNIKAMWLSQFDLNAVYTDGNRQREKEAYLTLIRQMLDRVVETGINTVIVQVRPNMDSMYPSEICPTSKYVVGEYGRDAIYDPFSLIVTALVFLLILYFAVSPLFGYAELRDESLHIRYGFIMKVDIPYSKIRSVKRRRRVISYSTVSLKCDVEHIEIGYGSFDETTISLVDADEFVEELCLRSDVREG